MRNSRRTEGYTLFEMIVVLGVMGLAMSTLSALLMFGMNSFRRSDPRLDAQRALLRFCGTMTREMLTAKQGSLVLTYPSGNPNTGDLALAFPTPRNLAHAFQVEPVSGLPEYQAHMIYYRNPVDNTLRLQRQAIALPSTSPLPLSAAAIQAVAAASADPVKLSSVQSFQALDFGSLAPTQLSTNHLRFRVAITASTGDPMELTVPVSLVQP